MTRASHISRGSFLLVFRVLCWFCATTSSSSMPAFLSPWFREEAAAAARTSSVLVSANNSPTGSGTPSLQTTTNITNNGNNSSWTLRSDRPATEVVRDIVIIFFAGVAIIASLVCATYVITVLFDRVRGWMGIPPLDDDSGVMNGVGGNGRSNNNPVHSQPVHVGRLVHEAGLYGISKEQRMLLVQSILPPTPYDGKTFKMTPSSSTTNPRASEDEGEKDVEVGDVDSGMIEHVDADQAGSEGPHGPDADDIDYEHTCSICLTQYEVGEDLLRSNKCAHVFHWECCQEWLQKRDVCPYCRTPMFTADELRGAAIDVLGPASLEQLSTRASNPSLGREEPAPASNEPPDEPAGATDETISANHTQAQQQERSEEVSRSQGQRSSEPDLEVPETQDELRAVPIGPV